MNINNRFDNCPFDIPNQSDTPAFERGNTNEPEQLNENYLTELEETLEMFGY